MNRLDAARDLFASVEWVRLAYDIEATIRKITASESLNAGMAQRLREGV